MNEFSFLNLIPLCDSKRFTVLAASISLGITIYFQLGGGYYTIVINTEEVPLLSNVPRERCSILLGPVEVHLTTKDVVRKARGFGLFRVGWISGVPAPVGAGGS